jgi:adenylate cyclase
MLDKLKKLRYALIAPPVALALIYLISSTSVFQKLEYLSVDWRYAYRAASDPDQHEDLVIVGVAEPCLKTFGKWPWARSIHGEFLEIIANKNPKVVAFDFMFTESDKYENDLKFGQAMASLNSVVTGAASDTDIEIETMYGKLLNSTTYVEILHHISDLKDTFERWFLYDQLIGKALEADQAVPKTLASNLVSALNEASSIKDEDGAKEMLTNLFVYFLGEFSQNEKLKEIAPTIEAAKTPKEMLAACKSFILEMTTPGNYLGKTKPITNIIGDTSGVDSTDFTLFPVRELLVNGNLGYVNADPNSIDGTRRKLPLIVKSGEYIFPTLVSQMVMQYVGANSEDVTIDLGNKITFKGKDKVIEAPIDENGLLAINYRNLENGEPGVDDAYFKLYPYSIMASSVNSELKGNGWNQNIANPEGKIVLIGQSATGLSDFGPLPNVSMAPLMLVHANAVNNILQQDFLTFFPDMPIIIGWLVLGWGTLIILNSRSIAPSVITPAILIAIYAMVCFWLFKTKSLQLPFFWPLLSFFAIHLGANLISWWEDYKMRDNIKGMFGTYISADLVDQMIESGEEPKLGGVDTEITAFFSDVQSFSVFSELLTSPQLVDLMNEYLTAMTDILQEEKGTLDKYIGDAIVAMYGAPIPLEDHAHRAIRTCVRVYHRQIELREKWASEGDKWPSVVPKMQTRMGCNTGIATVGNMGSHNRFNYTMMGDMVNLAARCESGAKAYGAYIMVTEESMKASVAFKDDIQFRYLDKIIVKGRSIPVAMYEVLGMKDEISAEVKNCLEIYNSAIERYLAQDFIGAYELFVKAQDFELHRPGITPNVKDNPSIIMAERALSMKDRPYEEGWDGVYVMTSK